MTGSLIFECDSCYEKSIGASKHELSAQGWMFHSVGENRWIVCCGVCEARFAARRKAAA